MLAHPNIKIMLNTDYREIAERFRIGELIYTGPIDEFFDFRFGKLPYRSLEFQFETLDRPRLPGGAGRSTIPNENPYTRCTEFKYLTGRSIRRRASSTSIRRRTAIRTIPCRGRRTPRIYRQYQALADRTPDVHFSGRLATYKYYNMDQVVAQALTLYNRLIRRETPRLVEAQTA